MTCAAKTHDSDPKLPQQRVKNSKPKKKKKKLSTGTQRKTSAEGVRL